MKHNFRIKIELIEKFMQEKNLTPQQFSEFCKISLDDLELVLGGEVDIEGRILFAIAVATKIKIQDFIEFCTY